MVGRGIIVLGVAVVGALGAPPAARAADPELVPGAASVAVGASVEVTASGCPSVEDEQRPEVFLVVGSGADAVRAATGAKVAEGTYRITVPGWVDPDEPAVVAGTCVVGWFSTVTGQDWNAQFTYPDVAIDVTPGSGPGATAVANRTAADSGQVLVLSGEGCTPGAGVDVELRAGADLALRSDADEVLTGPISTSSVARADGTFEAQVHLVEHNWFDVDTQPLDLGAWWLRVSCGSVGIAWDVQPEREARPIPIEITGQRAVASIAGARSATDPERFEISGEGCAVGAEVTADLTQDARLGDGPVPVDAPSAVAGADGRWVLPVAVPADLRTYLLGEIRCGEPTAEGFSYGERALLVVPAEPEGPLPPTTDDGTAAPAVAVPGVASYTG
jgi:hypothetical protein